MSSVTSGLGWRPFSRLASPREAVRQFTPNWFAVTMGTGVLAIALALVPGGAPLLKSIGRDLWLFNIGLFSLFTLMYAARWMFFFHGARRIFGHSVVSMFFGCIPMGMATIINGIVIYAFPSETAVRIAEALWWGDAAMAIVCGIAIPFMMFTRQAHAIDQMTAVWLLPVVAAEVAAASGGLLAPHVAPAAQLTMLVTSYILWALSVPLAMSILTILVLRMAIHKLPHASMAASSWLSLGPIGTGALALLLMGSAAPSIFAASGLAEVGLVAHGIGVIGGLLLWAFGLWWMASAILITLRYLREGLPFNLGWWGYTFPLGVYALATLRLSQVFPITAFAIFGTLLVAALALLWLGVGALTLRGAWRGDLFVSPCLVENSSTD
jgi:C4-dicarboxylate transporter/malic acid transport protein